MGNAVRGWRRRSYPAATTCHIATPLRSLLIAAGPILYAMRLWPASAWSRMTPLAKVVNGIRHFLNRAQGVIGTLITVASLMALAGAIGI